MKIAMIEFIQINMNKAEVAHVELLKLLKEEEYFITLMQEPYKHKGKIVKQPKGCTRIPTIDKYDQGARTAIYASESLGICELKALCSRDCSCLLYTSPSPRD